MGRVGAALEEVDIAATPTHIHVVNVHAVVEKYDLQRDTITHGNRAAQEEVFRAPIFSRLGQDSNLGQRMCEVVKRDRL